jgi:nucleoid-associated protein YgaU
MSTIQFWLSNAEGEKFRFPVNPESITIPSPFGFEDVAVNRIGELTIIGDRLPKEYLFTSFFPRDYNEAYCEYSGFPKPWEAVDFIEAIRDSRQPCRMTVTGTPINAKVTIRDFEILPEKAGSPGDIYFTISLKEYKEVVFRKIDKQKVSKQNTRPDTKKTAAKSYTVVKGDSLWKIAQRQYGNGSKWPTIYNANKSVIGKNPNLIKPGQKLVIPSA